MFGGVSGTPLYSIPSENDNLKQVYGGAEMPEGLPELKPEDMTVSTVRSAVSHCCVTNSKTMEELPKRPGACKAMLKKLPA
jgi:hypothetical protein